MPSEQPVAPDAPFVLAVTATGGPRIAALNEAAEAAGLAVGEPLADARAKADTLQIRTIDSAADDKALRRLALWATRYTPTASPWTEENGADGFFLDIEGAAHLFGGEDRLVADLSFRLDNNFGLPARIAVAATPGAAWALSRFATASFPILPPGREVEALAPLPIAALRLSPETRTTLRRLGFKTVGTLLDKPRAPFAARFPAELLRRVDQALARVDEPLVPVIAPPVYHSLRYLIEPILTQEAVVAHADRLMQTLARILVRDDVGARALRLSLYRVDGAVMTIDIGLTLPTRDTSHVTRLIDLKLEAMAATQDAGFGFEAIGLAVTRAEPMAARQVELAPSHASEGSGWGHRDQEGRCAALIDTLRQRLGPHSVRQFVPVESHCPKRAEALAPIEILPPPERSTWPEPEQTRPLLLLPQAEPAEDVLALVPDGPPRRFSWRGVTYDVAIAGAQGPQRIASEWWRDRSPKPTRDYFLVEDMQGRRFWLFREGLFGRETTDARWFVHGLFA
jgi:protein ImuB